MMADCLLKGPRVVTRSLQPMKAAIYAKAMRLIIELADRANPYVEAAAPWTLAKDPTKSAQLQNVCTIALNLFRQIAVYLSPVLPRLAEQCGQLLGDPITSWQQSQQPLLARPSTNSNTCYNASRKEDVEAMIEEMQRRHSRSRSSLWQRSSRH